VVLVSYLIYLRRQVRLEEAIRDRRAARMAGTRRTSAADDRDLDEWARRGREVTRRPQPPSEEVADDVEDEEIKAVEVDDAPEDGDDELADEWAEDDDSARVRGVGEPLGLLPARRRGSDDESAEPKSALPPLLPAPPPPLPVGTSLVTVDDDEQDLHDLDAPVRAGSRRAVHG
jgi:hypothetical protein